MAAAARGLRDDRSLRLRTLRHAGDEGRDGAGAAPPDGAADAALHRWSAGGAHRRRRRGAAAASLGAERRRRRCYRYALGRALAVPQRGAGGAVAGAGGLVAARYDGRCWA
jgi:hypothetical protein